MGHLGGLTRCPRAELIVTDLGRLSYRDAQRRQDAAAARKRRDRAFPDRLLLMELEPVVTLGRGGGPEQLLTEPARLNARGIDFIRSDRGGGAAYHGPGQLTVYPIVDLSGDRDLHAYLRKLEGAALDTLADFRVPARRNKGLTGVWVENRKIAAVGVRVRNWVSTHGLALNIDTDLANYSLINQCGLNDKGVTSIERELGTAPPRRQVLERFVAHFCRLFGYRPDR